MAIDWEYILDPDTVMQYTRKIAINGDWVSYRYPTDPYGASMRAGRFNTDGQSGLYFASGTACAQAEVPDNSPLMLYRVRPQEVTAFDLVAFAEDKELTSVLTVTGEQGGHAICQSLSTYLTEKYPLSAIFYQSQKLAQIGEIGYCLCLLPRDSQAFGDDFMTPHESSDDARTE
jgi:hypothetical protein